MIGPIVPISLGVAAFIVSALFVWLGSKDRYDDTYMAVMILLYAVVVVLFTSTAVTYVVFLSRVY